MAPSTFSKSIHAPRAPCPLSQRPSARRSPRSPPASWLNEKLDATFAAYGQKPDPRKLKHIAVKEAVFPFARFPGVDTLLGPEMRSTGEVIGLDTDFALAFAKSQLGAGVELPRDGTVFVSVRDADKPRVLPAIRILVEQGFKVLATGGTARFLGENGITATKINKVLEGRPHIEDAIRNRQVQLVINTTDGNKAISDSKSLRRATLMQKVPYYTTMAGAEAAAQAIKALKAKQSRGAAAAELFRLRTERHRSMSDGASLAIESAYAAASIRR